MPRSKVRQEDYATIGCEVPLSVKKQFQESARQEGLRKCFLGYVNDTSLTKT